MKNYTLHLPEGVYDSLWKEASKKDDLKSTIKNIFKAYSYNLIETPTFEYLDVFTIGEESMQRSDIYKWVNRQGELVAMRNDNTRAIARVFATQNKHLPFPQRYCYIANCFRYPKRYQGKMHEFTQAGVELIGDCSVQSDVEIIKIAIESLLATGIEDFTIHIGSTQFLSCILHDVGLPDEEQKQVYQSIQNKDAVNLRAILKRNNANEEMLEAIFYLVQRVGKVDILQEVKNKITSDQSQKALTYLEDIYCLLEDYGLTEYVRFDFSILSYGHYYTNMMFQGFASGIGSAVVEGGRYDTLLCKFGTDAPAVGFGINIDLLLQKLIQDSGLEELNHSKTLFVYHTETHQIANQIASHFRKNKMTVENYLSDNIDQAIEYAQTTKMGGLLYFKEADSVEIYNLQEGTKYVTYVGELLGVRN